MHRYLAAVIVVFAVALGGPLVAQKPDAETEVLTRTYEQAFNKGDAKALGALYAKEAVRMNPDGQMLYGQAAIEKHWATLFQGEGKGAKLALKSGRMQQVSPDVRIIEGTYEVTGGKMPGSGRYVNTVVREGGQWRLASVVVMAETGGMQKK